MRNRNRFFKKYRHMALALVGWGVFLVFFFLLKSAIPPRHFIHCRLDDLIPFVKGWIFAYCLWYFYLAVSLIYFGIVSKPDFIRLQSYLFIGFAVCLFIYIVYPNAINFRPAVPLAGQSGVSRIVALLFAVDSSVMVTPSMHVFAAVAIHISLVKSRRFRFRPWILALSLAVCVLICLSTVLIKQHSAVDVFWGIVLAAALYFPIYKFFGIKGCPNAVCRNRKIRKDDF